MKHFYPIAYYVSRLCSITLLFTIGVARVSAQSPADSTDPFLCQSPVYLVYQARRTDKTPLAFYEAQLRLNEATLNKQLKNGTRTAKQARQIREVVTSSFKHQPEKNYPVRIAISSKVLWLSFSTKTEKRETVIANGKTFKRDISVSYLKDYVDLSQLAGIPPLPLNTEVVTLLKPNSSHKDFSEEFLMIHPGSSSNMPTGKYFPVTIEWTTQRNTRFPHRIFQGKSEAPLEDILYEDYKKIGETWIPRKIVQKSFGRMSMEDPIVPLSETVFTLKESSATVPSGLFDIPKRLKKGDLLQHDNGVTEISFTLDPSKSLTEQHAIADQLEEAQEKGTKRQQGLRRMNGGILLTLAGIGVIAYWLFRRFQRLRRERT